MSTSTQPRQPSGTPTGGQFAGKSNPESDAALQIDEIEPALSGVMADMYDKSRAAGRSHEDALEDVRYETELDYRDIPRGSSHDQVMDVRRAGGDLDKYALAMEKGSSHDEALAASLPTGPARLIMTATQVGEVMDQLQRQTSVLTPDHFDRSVLDAALDAGVAINTTHDLVSATHFALLAKCRAGHISWADFRSVDPYEDLEPDEVDLLDIAHRASRAAVGDEVDHRVARALPSYTEVEAEFSAMPGRTFRLMARDMPRIGSDWHRRFTNLDTGTEVFLTADGNDQDEPNPYDAVPMFKRMVVTKRPKT